MPCPAAPGQGDDAITVPSSNPLTRKLETFTRLSQDDRLSLDRLAGQNLRRMDARQDLIREGDKPQALNLILSGWACRYKTLEDGRRQIVSFFLPGDLCDLNIFVLRRMDHCVGTLSPATFAQIPRALIEEVVLHHPRITQALWWENLVSSAIQREWTLSLGQRDAAERLGHLFCEIFLRLGSVGLTGRTTCELPLTQTDLAEATGLSTVHVNRTLQTLRSNGLVVLKGKMLEIPDLRALMDASLFNPDYLHLQHEGSHLDANG